MLKRTVQLQSRRMQSRDRLCLGAGLHYRSLSERAGKRPLQIVAGMGFSLALLGCGQQYRPVVSAINPVGPAAQPTKYAIAVASPSSTTAGLLSVVDVAGDTILATPQIIPSPTYFTTLANGSQGFAINAQNSLSDIADLAAPSQLLTSVVVQTTLPPNANAPSISAFTLGNAVRLFVPEIGRSAVAVLSTATPALQQEIAVGANPVYVVGPDLSSGIAAITPRAYVLSTGTGTTAGQAAAIEGTSLGISAIIPLGINPVFGVETGDVRRVFIVNKGSGTISVINVTNNALDNVNPVIPATGTLGVNPVWADLSTVTNQLVVLNAGNGITPGTLSIISIPLCNVLANAGNSTCNLDNPSDSAAFGTVLATVTVGVNPSMVSVLADGSRAYVVNQGSSTVPGSLSVVNLASGTVTATIPAATAFNPNGSINPTGTPTCPDGTVLTCVYGHPNTVAATTGTPTGKVYLTAPDSNYMTVLETDTDIVDTHINLQGAGVRVRVSAQ